MARSGRIHQRDPFEPQFADAVGVPASRWRGARRYLEQIRRIKASVGIPVIASLNGMTAETWLTFAASVEQAGADALELNMYEVATDPSQSGIAIERDLRNAVAELKRRLQIPIAVKLTPFFTAFADVAHQLDRAGADGLILFNRFYQPDIDIDTMTAVHRLELSTAPVLLRSAGWFALQLRCSRRSREAWRRQTTGSRRSSPARAVQMVSAVGTDRPTTMRDGLVRWMESRQVSSLDDVRGRVDTAPDDDLLERAISARSSWTDTVAVIRLAAARRSASRCSRSATRRIK